jgi:hypothetical protein
MEIFILWVILAVIIGFANHSRGNGFITGFLLSFILSPLVGLIIIVLTKKNEEKLEKRMVNTGKMRKCSHCAEIIKPDAKICRFCGKECEEK